MKNIYLILFVLLPLVNYGQIPKNWQGHYKGKLAIQSQDKTTKYHMEIIFSQLNDSTYKWTIIYGKDSSRQERKYLLKKTGENQYVVDEQNGIILSMNLMANSFVSVFEVQGNLIHARYTFKKKCIYFELTSSSSRSETGNLKPSKDSEETIPLVYSYQTVNFQNAILKKVK